MFDGLFYINIPRLSHNGMENARTTIKKQLHKMYQSRCRLRTPDEGQKGCPKHVGS